MQLEQQEDKGLPLEELKRYRKLSEEDFALTIDIIKDIETVCSF